MSKLKAFAVPNILGKLMEAVNSTDYPNNSIGAKKYASFVT